MGLTYGPLGTVLSELFPTAVRYTGSSLTFNLAGIFGASLAPYAATWLAKTYGLQYVGYYLCAGAVLVADRPARDARNRATTCSDMRVAIVGGPGIGKSTLLRQLGDLYHNGSYGEGEEGVWDPRVLEDIDAGRNPVGVTAYFGRLYDANYRDAADNDRPDKVIFFEGARITLEAHIAEYPPEHHAELRKVLAIGDAWNPDRVIVLTSNTDTVEKHIRQRNRPHESAENMVRRFKLIDGEFRRLAPQYPNTVVINRDNMEFHGRRGLKAIIEAAGLPMFREVPLRNDRALRSRCMTRYWLMKCEPERLHDRRSEARRPHQLGRRAQLSGAQLHARRHAGRRRRPVLRVERRSVGVTGLATIVRAGYPEPRQARPIWHMVDIAFVERFAAVVPLETLKATRGLEKMMVTQKGSRLSVQPATKAEYDIVVRLGRRTVRAEASRYGSSSVALTPIPVGSADSHPLRTVVSSVVSGFSRIRLTA